MYVLFIRMLGRPIILKFRSIFNAVGLAGLISPSLPSARQRGAVINNMHMGNMYQSVKINNDQ